MSIVCACKLILFTQLYFCHSRYRRGHGRSRPAVKSPAVSAVNGLSSLLSANHIAPIQSWELYLVLWVFIYVACKLQLEAVTYDEINTVDFSGFASRYSFIVFITAFFSNFPVHAWFRSLLTRVNYLKTLNNKLMPVRIHTLWEWNFPCLSHCFEVKTFLEFSESLYL